MWLCLNCNEETEPGTHQVCPHCGSTHVPADLDDKVTITLTRHELRVLTIWAERWAMDCAERTPEHETMRRVVYGITDRLEMQLLGNPTPLTIVGEINQLRDRHPNLWTNVPDPPDPIE